MEKWFFFVNKVMKTWKMRISPTLMSWHPSFLAPIWNFFSEDINDRSSLVIPRWPSKRDSWLNDSPVLKTSSCEYRRKWVLKLLLQTSSETIMGWYTKQKTNRQIDRQKNRMDRNQTLIVTFSRKKEKHYFMSAILWWKHKLVSSYKKGKKTLKYLSTYPDFLEPIYFVVE